MSNNNFTSKTISELCNNEYIFHMPTYQRGYRWESLQVTNLLDDIWEFFLNKDKQNLGKYYCLQPIVIKKKSTEGIEWELIDGQQRLTTIYILLKLLENRDFPEPIFSIKFDRDNDNKERENYLLNIRDNAQKECLDRIDFHYFNNTVKVARAWIEATRKKHTDITIHNTLGSILTNYVQIIWYEIDDSSNTKDVFKHLNDGKIPLTNSELIKALLLNCRHFKVSSNEEINNRIVRMEQERIAILWDEIEITLNNEEFWTFINEKYNEKSTRIEYIFDLIYSKNKNISMDKIKNFDTFSYFEDKIKLGEKVSNIWDEVKHYYRTFQDWYDDYELYNKIGYLVHYTKQKRVNELIEESYTRTRNDFKKYLNDEIRKNLNVKNLETLSYDTNRTQVEKVLVLYNIETLVQAVEKRRFPFSKLKISNESIAEKWSIEHIYAQNSQMLRKEQLSTWLETHMNSLNRRLNGVFSDKKGKIQDLLSEMENAYTNIENITEVDFANLFSKLQEFIDNSIEDEIHNIKNLTLLNCSQNSSLSNSVFDVKRQKIIEMTERGEFIPVCTMMVFQKFYSHSVRQFDYWSKEDGEAYLESMNRSLEKYLTREDENND